MFYVAWYGKLLVECGVWGCRVLLLCLSICTVFFTVHTHPHPFNVPFPGLPGWAGTRKAKPIWILLKQETLSGNGISWAICKSAPRSRQITTPAPHHSVFYRPDALPAAQSTTSKHWRHEHWRHCTCFLKFIAAEAVLLVIMRPLFAPCGSWLFLAAHFWAPLTLDVILLIYYYYYTSIPSNILTSTGIENGSALWIGPSAGVYKFQNRDWLLIWSH